MLVDGCDRKVKLAGELPCETLYLCVVATEVLESEKTLTDVIERCLLLLEADEKREGPLDIVAAIEVVADP